MKNKRVVDKLKKARQTIRKQQQEIKNLNDQIKWIKKDMSDLLVMVDKFIPSDYYAIVSELEAIEQIYGENSRLFQKTT